MSSNSLSTASEYHVYQRLQFSFYRRILNRLRELFRNANDSTQSHQHHANNDVGLDVQSPNLSHDYDFATESGNQNNKQNYFVSDPIYNNDDSVTDRATSYEIFIALATNTGQTNLPSEASHDTIYDRLTFHNDDEFLNIDLENRNAESHHPFNNFTHTFQQANRQSCPILYKDQLTSFRDDHGIPKCFSKENIRPNALSYCYAQECPRQSIENHMYETFTLSNLKKNKTSPEYIPMKPIRNRQ